MSIIKFFPRNKYKLFQWFMFVIFIILAFAGGWLFNYFSNESSPLYLKPVRQGGYNLINPLLFYDAPVDIESVEYGTLKEKLSKFIGSKVSDGKLNKVSLYFRDLSKLGWVNINPNERYYPASLMKVPTMISILRYAEFHPEILSKKIFYDGSFDYNAVETIKPLKQIQSGNYYTVNELILYMIEYSDNNAAKLIHEQISEEFFQEVFTDLGISIPPNSFNTKNFDYLTVKDYASFFRVLYNSTYLSREMSEKALNLLLIGDFPQGIEAGVPLDVKTAQKFGESTIVDKNNKIITLELHDCGIVYYPNRPYLLCVMTSGLNFIDSENMISSLSSIIYNEINKNKIP